MISNLKIENNTCTFDMKAKDIMTANALRRALLQDVETFAPANVKFYANTSCQTDEYIAHRIGLIPFLCDECIDLSIERLEVKVSNRTVTTRDLVGKFKSMYDIDIIKLIDGQDIHAHVYFEKGTGEKHARFSPVSAVGYEVDGDKIHFSFESINGQNPSIHFKKAVQSIRKRLENVNSQLLDCNDVLV